MRRLSLLPGSRWAGSLVLGLLVAALCGEPVGARDARLRALIVGGGPEPQHNQVAIERNVDYVSRLLPAGTPRVTLFANGDSSAQIVLYEVPARELSAGERALALLWGGRGPAPQRYRAPQLGRLDGPARRGAVAAAFERLGQESSTP